MAEFSFIERYCKDLGSAHGDTVLAVGDDAAIVNVPDGYELTISVDTMVEGTHFFSGLAPELLAHKALAVNLSDMAAMGARPKWAVVASCLPELEEDWVARFCHTLGQVAKKYGVQIIGGDTTEGPRAISITIMGLLPKGLRLSRSGAQPGDKVYVSGAIGDAALALTKLHGDRSVSDEIFKEVAPALHMPEPQVTLGQRLLGQATSCLDLSDGLVGDCEHIAKASKVSVELDIALLPLSDAYRRYMQNGGFIRYAVAGGDDYQLLFTANEDKTDVLKTIASDLNVRITEVGRVLERGEQNVILLQDGKPTSIKPKAYQHFS